MMHIRLIILTGIVHLEAIMSRYAFSCVTTITGVTGVLLSIGGIGTIQHDKGRVTSIGMILVGLSVFPYRNQIREGAPKWAKSFAIAYALFFIIIGAAIFLLSWL